MTTNKKRLVGHLPESLYESFQQFKEAKGIQWDSDALCQILSEYFNFETAHSKYYERELK